MKRRLMVVCNSSSCSSVIISDKIVQRKERKEYDDLKGPDSKIRLPLDGYTKKFTNEYDSYSSTGDKLNFCAIQLEYLRNSKEKLGYSHYALLNMFKRVIKQVTGSQVEIEHIPDVYHHDGAYIEDGCSVTSSSSMDMFTDDDTLERFLFNDRSEVRFDYNG